MNLLGPSLVRDLVSLIQRAEADDTVRALVFKSADPDYFIAHVDVTQIKEYRTEAAKLTGEASIGLMFRHLSASRLVTIAQIEGRVRRRRQRVRAGVRHALCRTRVGDFQPARGADGCDPRRGQHPTPDAPRGPRPRARGHVERGGLRCGVAERYGWINRAVPANALNDFVRSLAHRIAKFPAASLVAVKDRVNAIALAPVADFRRDSDLFGEGAQTAEAQSRFQAALKRGFQTRDAEMDLAGLLGKLADD
jgi:enoyl-CoA hydratase/carnithine racemase